MTVGLLKNHIFEKMSIQTKWVSLAEIVHMALFQQPHCPYLFGILFGPDAVLVIDPLDGLLGSDAVFEG